MPPLPWGWGGVWLLRAVPTRAGRNLRGPPGYLTHGLCRPGRAELEARFAVAQVLLILPYSSRRERRGEGAERLRVGAAQAMGAAVACSWWCGFLPVLPKEERMGYQSRKGRFLGVPALEGSERAVGAGLFRHVGGRFGAQPEAGPCRYGGGSRRPRDSVAGRAGGFAPRNMAGGGGTPALRLALGWAGLGRYCIPRGRAAKRRWAEKPFSGLPARRY